MSGPFAAQDGVVSPSPAAQRGQRQALLTRCSGTRSSASASMKALVHQHSASSLPVSAGAHWLRPPQTGQIVSGSASILVVARCRRLQYRSSGALGGAVYQPSGKARHSLLKHGSGNPQSGVLAARSSTLQQRLDVGPGFLLGVAGSGLSVRWTDRRRASVPQEFRFDDFRRNAIQSGQCRGFPAPHDHRRRAGQRPWVCRYR